MTRAHRVIIATLCTLILLVLPGWALRHERRTFVAERANALAEVESRNAELRAQNAELLNRIQSMGDDGDALEASVRERLGWVGPNETVVVFESPEGSP